MKTVIKILIWLIVPVVVLLLFLFGAFYLFSEHILKLGIETAATKALGVGVHIDDLDLSVLKGTLAIENITVKNPPGYTYDNLLQLNTGRLTASVASLLSDTVRIKELKLDGLDLVIEQKTLSNNLKDLISSTSARDKAKSQRQTTGKKLHIKQLEITNIKVKVKLLPVPGKVDTAVLKLASIKMSDLGTDNKLDTAILTNKIMLAIADGIVQEGVGVLPEEIIDATRSALDTTLDLGRTAIKEGEKLLETGKDRGTELIEGFKDLLKPKKDE